MWSRDLLKLIFFSVFAVICLSQCYSIVVDFLQYPNLIDMYDVPSNIFSRLPGITICNNNRLAIRKVVSKNANIAKAIEQKFPGWIQKSRPWFNDIEFNEFRDEVARIFAQVNYSSQDEIDKATMNEMFSIRPDTKPFITWIGCARTWTDSIQCNSLTQIDSIQDRRCITLLHKGAILNDIINRPHVFNSTTQSDIEDQKYFKAKEILNIIVNFDPEDYGDLKRQIGARILFHSNKHVATSTDLDFFVTRGYKYEFNVDREENLLPDSEALSCTDYEEKHIDAFKTRIDPRVPLYTETCYQNCVIRNVIYRFECWPATFPYFRNDSYDPGLKLKACSSFKDSNHFAFYNDILRLQKNNKSDPKSPSNSSTYEWNGNNNSGEFRKAMRMYTRIRRHCHSKCLLSCRMTHYTVTMAKTAWPSDVQIIMDNSNKFADLRRCCALISVKTTQYSYNVQEFKSKYNIVDTIGDIGGLLAVWLGLSIVSVYHTIQKLLGFCNARSLSAKIHQGLDGMPVN